MPANSVRNSPRPAIAISIVALGLAMGLGLGGCNRPSMSDVTGSIGGNDALPNNAAGLRRYAPGDAVRAIAWKTLAKEQELMVKRFHGQHAAQVEVRVVPVDPEDPAQRVDRDHRDAGEEQG